MVAPSVDVLALLRPAQVTVTVAGIVFPLQATTASQWLGAIALDPEKLQGIMPGLIADDDLETMLDLMLTHPDITDRWANAARTALGRAAGRDWWWVRNLSRRCLSIWIYVNGTLLRQNVDAKTMLFPDWLDACYTRLWENGDEDARTKLDLELNMRPAGVAIKRSRRQVQQEMAAFAAD